MSMSVSVGVRMSVSVGVTVGVSVSGSVSECGASERASQGLSYVTTVLI